MEKQKLMEKLARLGLDIQNDKIKRSDIQLALAHIVESSEKGVQRTVTITVPLDMMAKALGYEISADPYDDVYHNGFSSKDIQNDDLDLPRKYDDINKIFPSQVAMALEDAERDAYASAILKKRLSAVEEACQLIGGSMEYQDGETGGFISTDASVESADADLENNTLTLTIKNPEHLINGIVEGVGMYGAPLPTQEAADEKEIKEYIHNIADFFEVYGERKPAGYLNERWSPNIDKNYLESLLEGAFDDVSPEDAGAAIVEAVDNEFVDDDATAIEMVAKALGKPAAELEGEVAKARGETGVGHASVASKKQAKAGPGAGVEVELKGEIEWEEKAGKIEFKPAEMDVNFKSYYNSKMSEGPGVLVELDTIENEDEVADFKYRMGDEGGTLHITFKNALREEDRPFSTLFLSGGYIRHQFKVGDYFRLAIELDKDYAISAKGAGKFLDGGVDAWNDLDEPNEDDDEAEATLATSAKDEITLLERLKAGDYFKFADEHKDQNEYLARGNNWYGSEKGYDGGPWHGEGNMRVIKITKSKK